MMKSLFAFALVVPFAGCLHQVPASTTSDETLPAQPTNEPSKAALVKTSINITVQRSIEWTDCQGSLAQTGFVYGTQPGEHPPGWEPNPVNRPLVGVFMTFWDCARVHWGPFERPLRILFEGHGNFEPQSDCNEYTGSNGFGLYRFGLASLWVNDTEVANWLKATYNLPIYSSPMNWTHETVGPLGTHTLTWGLAGQTQSFITFPLDTAQRDGFPEPDWRFFWFNATNVSYLDLVLSYDEPGVFGRIGHGELYPPMLAAKYTNQFADSANWFLNGTMSGTIHRFSDFECKHPLE
jgi:hypothetical protein